MIKRRLFLLPSFDRGSAMAETSRHRRPVRRLLGEQCEARLCLSAVAFAPHVIIESEAAGARSVYATDLEGEAMSIALFRSMPIESVSFADGLISLISGDRLIPFESILEFRAGRA